MTASRQRVFYAFVFLAIVGLGLLCRWPAIGLPWPFAKYAGSTLWGAMVYAGLRAIAPRSSISANATAACAIAICVELFRLFHLPELDAFRATLAGQLTLGRIFSPWNMVAYAVGISIAALADQTAAKAGASEPPR